MNNINYDEIIDSMKGKKYYDLNKIEKDLFDNYDTELNTCDMCQVVANSEYELYWQGDCEDSYHECMTGYDALCDDCFGKTEDKFKENEDDS